MPDLIRHFFYCTHLAYVGTLTLSKSYTLRLPNKNVQAHFCLVTLVVFHVKPYEASEAETSLLVSPRRG
jgi:hypothetical protein